MGDMANELQSRVLQAISDGEKLNIQGGNSKAFYGPTRTGIELSIRDHSGIVSYEPSELVVTVKAGTPLKELEQALAEKSQMLS